MELIQKEIQLQFQGFLNTPFLWKGNVVWGLQQWELKKVADFVFKEPLPNNLRLGKRVERFVGAELKRHDAISICCENIQVQHNKTTLGEIDCILKQHQTPIHLEIVYKFYLYDPELGNSEIYHWIGPNRKDTLIKKLNKLRDKQLPLLHNPHTQPILDDLNINLKDTQQQVYFKAQLFLPYKNGDAKFSLLNADCIKGFYIHFSELAIFKDCKFYIPKKNNWLVETSSQVPWMTYSLFFEIIQNLIKNETSPLCWIKFKNGEIEKCFVVWWN